MAEVGRARLAILTGGIRAGKTTAALRVAELAREAGYLCGGFLSPDHLDPNGAKVGIDVLDLARGERRRLASVVEDLGGPRVGPYSFDQSSVDWAIAVFETALVEKQDLIFADEIGRLEIERGEGFAPLLPPLIAGAARRALVVARLGLHERLREAAGRVDVRVFHLAATPEVRESTPAEVLGWLFAEEAATPDSANAPSRLCPPGALGER